MSSVRQKRPRIKLGRSSYREIREKVLERDGWRCQRCGRATDLQIHHIRFRSMLGDDEPDNLITLCCRCHASTHRWIRIAGPAES